MSSFQSLLLFNSLYLNSVCNNKQKLYSNKTLDSKSKLIANIQKNTKISDCDEDDDQDDKEKLDSNVSCFCFLFPNSIALFSINLTKPLSA